MAAIGLREVLHFVVYDTFVDDAYIFMRYGQHLGSGHGLTYNGGEHVMGFTSPLYVVLLGGLDAIVTRAHLELAIAILNTALFAGVAVILLRICRRTHPVWWLLPLLWLFYLPFVDGSVNGMETMLFLALQYGALLLALERRWNWVVVLVSLSVLTRPEGALFAACLGAVVLAFSRPLPRPWAGLAGGAVLLGGWAAVAVGVYGSVLPQSVLAKSSLSAGGLVGSGTTALDKLVVLALGVSSDQIVGKSTAVHAGATILALALLVLFAIGAWQLWRERSPLLSVPLFFVATWLFYVAGDPARIWSWYAVPTGVAFWLCVALAAGRLLERVSVSRPQVALAAVVAVFCVVSIVVGVHQRSNGLAASNDEHIALTRFIDRRVPAARSIMLGDIGIVGWRTDLRVFDLAGLVSKGGTRNGPDGRLLSLGSLIGSQRPDIVSLQADPFSERYVVVSGVRRRSFDPAQRALTLRDYAVVHLTGRFLLVRRDLLRAA